MTQTSFLQENQPNESSRQSTESINEILLRPDGQRFEQLVRTFAHHRMARKRQRTEAWHDYFRRIAANSVIFYQHNAALFYDDIQCDSDQLQLSQSTYIHGDLHVGQFQYYNDVLSSERVFEIRSYQKITGPIIWDLKRVGANLSLIAYNKGFNDTEIIEVLDAFVQQYINSVMLPSDQKGVQRNSTENIESSPSELFVIQQQNSVLGSSHCITRVHEIEWELINTVANLITLAEELANCIARIHCEPPLNMCVTSVVKDLQITSEINDCAKTIRIGLSSSGKQTYLIKDIRCFAMIYAEIARRDHELFFQNFRNSRVFKGTEVLNDTRISHPLVYTRRIVVLVVGGGIGGLATALSFAQAGVQVRLLERNNDFREVGAGMQLAPNCSRVLDRLGVLQKVHVNAVFPKQIVWMDAMSGERLTCLDLGQKFVEYFGYPYIVVHRADLLNALYEACVANPLITLETNRYVTTVDERHKSIMVECTNGMRYDCDMVVAADGLWSTLRKFVYDDGDPLSVGYVTYRGTVGIDQVSKESGLENVQFWIGPDMHIVQYPVRRGELFNQGAVFKSKRLPDNTDQWGTKEELNERFSVGCEKVKNVLALLQTNYRWPVYDRNPLSKWSRGRLVLLGDAAHPMLQYAAQGAAQALADACALADAYKHHGPTNIEAVFREYEQERILFTSKIVHFARDIGNFAHQSGQAKAMRDEHLRMHDMHDFDCIKWMYGERQVENN